MTADRLPASEEFGIGGPSFGRAYDLSEIMGDEGVAGSLEVRYQAIPEWRGLQTVPYIYYDLGKVWNNDTDGESFSAASAGLGVRFAHELGINAQLGLAFPLTREPERPIYGDHHSPRLLMQLGYGF
ncbi:MAG: BamA/TamA family outer membrane protein [Rickettsiales bacterium]|nr:BamA/TamA family outer membrane protein [Rickettsiales bacterium]